ncbi:hypothetical protein ABFU39_00315 [Xanthomonas campestris pv. raphani]|uniref:hypothetical protein n=2 Tax=Xanthomonas campestris TaxID=339 RepID=UPI002B229904|nr:hypothetical protein [Xanthomonas campestris]MEA9735278.1 hypothetical protein [Xanthomonas campestris pv. raphani]MEA9941645.1 hypothetical protein [Xanthomonas campestris pv. raphani]
MAMQKFFHIDKHSRLKPGHVIAVNEIGLSSFGRNFAEKFRAAGMSFTPPFEVRTSNEILRREYFLEVARRIFSAQGAKLNSRLSSLFCVEELESAKEFAARMKLPAGSPIFEVETASPVSRHDMSWLDFSFPADIESRMQHYHLYWTGHSIDENIYRPNGLPHDHKSLFEILIPGEVTIGQLVGKT